MCSEITGDHASFSVDDGGSICLWNICTFTSQCWTHLCTYIRLH